MSKYEKVRVSMRNYEKGPRTYAKVPLVLLLLLLPPPLLLLLPALLLLLLPPPLVLLLPPPLLLLFFIRQVSGSSRTKIPLFVDEAQKLPLRSLQTPQE